MRFCNFHILTVYSSDLVPQFWIVILARLLLEKFYVGELDKTDRDTPGIVEYQSDTQEGEFYEVLKRRVEKFFRGNEVTPPTQREPYLCDA